MLPYKVAKKYLKGPEQLVAKFDSLNDAKEFISAKIEQDNLLRVNTAYLIYDMGELIETIQGGTETGSGSGGGQQGQTGQQTTKQAFSPSPMQTSPRPPGMPPSSFKDIEDDKKK